MASCIPSKPWLDVIYEDSYVMVVNKPSGLLSVPGRGTTPDKTDSVLSRIQKRNPEAKFVHRLDMVTSGVMVVAKSREIEIKLRDQFRRHLPQKFYIAKVWGHPVYDEGQVDLPITVDWPNRPLQKICLKTGKPSRTRYQVLERYEDFTSRLLLMTLTGRSHQVRLHLEAIEHPILGDPLYAPPLVWAMAPRTLLHAETLLLRHPHFSTPFHIYCKPDF